MNTPKAIIISAGAALVVIGGLVYSQIDKIFPDEPTGPGSGDELPYEPEGPGSGDELPYEPEPTGPGSGDELPYEPEPTGPGSGDELPYEPEGPGSGDELPYEPEPTGPGSGDELPYEPEGPGSGDELPYEPEQTGPGSGDEISQSEDFKNKAVGSCDAISEGSTCVEYIGSLWQGPDMAKMNCSDAGIYSTGPCPRPAAGGCNMGPGTSSEVVTWHYFYGGGGYNAENIPYAVAACNSLPMANWVYGE